VTVPDPSILQRAFMVPGEADVEEDGRWQWLFNADHTDYRFMRQEQARPDGHDRYCDCEACQALKLIE
jgi:hypothetical protein